MRSSSFYSALLCIFTGVMLVVSCNKKEKEVEDGMLADFALVDKTFSDVQSMSDQAEAEGILTTYRTTPNIILSSCATITKDTTGSTRILTIDFGASACLCSDGIYRKGKIIVEYNGAYTDVGSIHTISFIDYFVNDNKVQGTKTVENKGFMPNGMPYYSVIVDGSVILRNGEGTISWKAARTREWQSGFSTPTPQDDLYAITGTGNLTTPGGKKYAYATTSPLNVALSCRWPRSGTVVFTPEGGTARTLDYGSGDCDALATVALDGSTTTINLR